MDFMNMQQFQMAIGYISQDLIPQENESKQKYMYFGLTTRKSETSAVYMRCVVKDKLVDQFFSQHSKGSIVMLYGETYSQYRADSTNRVNNLFNVLGWFYFADLDAHFDGLSDDEYKYLTNRLKAFRTSNFEEQQKILEKIT